MTYYYAEQVPNYSTAHDGRNKSVSARSCSLFLAPSTPSDRRHPCRVLAMSVLNITGEEADPVRSFVFREVLEYSKKRNEEDIISKEELERQKRDDRVEKNKAWRLKRAGCDKSRPTIKWDETEATNSRNKKCDIL